MSDLTFSVEDRRKRGYFTVDNVLLDLYGQELGPYGIAVYCVLARFANSDQEAWPGQATIAKRAGMSDKQVGRELAKLAELKIISITPRYNPKTKVHSSNLYTLLDIVGGGDTQSPGGRDSQSPGRDRKSDRTILKKKDSTTKEKKYSDPPSDF